MIEDACHRLEEILARSARWPLDDERPLFGLLFSTIDAMEEAGMRLREQHDLADAPLAALLAPLEAAAAGVPPERRSPAPWRRAETPPAAVVQEPESPPRPSPAPVSAVAKHSESTASCEQPRISAEKLDALLARSGELLVAGRRVEAR